LLGQRVVLEARIYNHSDLPGKAFAQLRAPSGWKIERGASATIAPHKEGKILLSAIAPDDPSLRRQVLGLAVQLERAELTIGEFSKAIVDYLIKTA
jgi:hypothetical protein